MTRQSSVSSVRRRSLVRRGDDGFCLAGLGVLKNERLECRGAKLVCEWCGSAMVEIKNKHRKAHHDRAYYCTRCDPQKYRPTIISNSEWYEEEE